MNAEQLRHILRAAANVTGERVFVVIGSQSILGSHPDAPRSLRRSVEGDTYPKDHPEKAIEVDGAIGELSPFHQEFGYYAHGVAPDTATLPEGWESRLVEFKVNDAANTVGLCLEKHDLAFSKLGAGRSKDIDFIRELLKHRLINRGKLQRLIESEKNDELRQLLVRSWTIVTSGTARRSRPTSSGEAGPPQAGSFLIRAPRPPTPLATSRRARQPIFQSSLGTSSHFRSVVPPLP